MCMKLIVVKRLWWVLTQYIFISGVQFVGSNATLLPYGVSRHPLWFKLLLLGFSYEAAPFLKFSRFEKNHVIRQSPMDVYIVPFLAAV